MKVITALPLILALAVSCFADMARCGPIRIFVSIPPQLEFVRRVGGPAVEVEILLGRGQNPHSFDPSPRMMARLGEARLFFRAGVAYEDHLVGRLAELFGSLKIVDTSEGIVRRSLAGGQGDDPHTWLAPALAKIQASNIRRALEAAAPENGAAFRANFIEYAEELDNLDKLIRKTLKPYRGRSVYVYHPSFGYFLSAYGLHQVAVERGGREPAARELAALMERMRRERVRTLFVQPEFPSPVADALGRALECRVVRLDPLATDYVKNMKKIARLVAGALERQD